MQPCHVLDHALEMAAVEAFRSSGTVAKSGAIVAVVAFVAMVWKTRDRDPGARKQNKDRSLRVACTAALGTKVERFECNRPKSFA